MRPDVKAFFDQVAGPIAQAPLPPTFWLYWKAMLAEWRTPPPNIPPLTRFVVLGISRHTLIDDAKIRRSGFTTKYKFEESARLAVRDIQARTAKVAA